MFPDDGVTKLDLARHYAAVAEVMLPLVRDRPLALHSFPRGIEGEGYFLKSAPKHFPDWIPRARVPKREGGALEQAVARDRRDPRLPGRARTPSRRTSGPAASTGSSGPTG